MRRAFVPPQVLDGLSPDKTLDLDDETAHRFTRVLRLSNGARVELFDGTGRVAKGFLEINERVHLRDATIEIHEITGPRITVAQALAKMDKLEQVVQRATELGVHKILFFEAEHSTVQFRDKSAQKIERLTRIAQDAARQSERFDVPLIAGPLSFTELVSSSDNFDGLKVVGDADAVQTLSNLLVREKSKAQKGVWLVVGPEGGLSPSEMTLLASHSILPVKWGPHVLRTETASLAAIAIIQAVLQEA